MTDVNSQKEAAENYRARNEKRRLIEYTREVLNEREAEGNRVA